MEIRANDIKKPPFLISKRVKHFGHFQRRNFIKIPVMATKVLIRALGDRVSGMQTETGEGGGMKNTEKCGHLLWYHKTNNYTENELI